MLKLANSPNPNLDKIDLKRSAGPFVYVDGGIWFDARKHATPLWLGYNASAMFGLAQQYSSWRQTNTSHPDTRAVESAWQRLQARVEKRGISECLSQAQPETFSGLHYQYISGSVIDQYSDEYQSMAQRIEDQIPGLEKQPAIAAVKWDPRCLKFTLEFCDERSVKKFAKCLLKAGILASPESSTSLKLTFQLNLAFRSQLFDLFWQRLHEVGEHFEDPDYSFPEVEVPVRDVNALYDFHEALIRSKSLESSGTATITFLKTQVESIQPTLAATIVTKANYGDFRQRILDMQSEIYEPARQTPPEEFDLLFASPRPLAIVVTSSERIVAMSFAGRLNLFTEERGVLTDPYLDDPTVYYSVDLTIVPEYRGGGMGRLMKQAMVLLALENGVSAIHGRNRDRLARGMWAINLSLGSYELQHLENDYPDDGPFRDCLYYRCPLEWPTKLTSADVDTILKRLPEMVNGKQPTPPIESPCR